MCFAASSVYLLRNKNVVVHVHDTSYMLFFCVVSPGNFRLFLFGCPSFPACFLALQLDLHLHCLVFICIWSAISVLAFSLFTSIYGLPQRLALFLVSPLMYAAILTRLRICRVFFLHVSSTDGERACIHKWCGHYLCGHCICVDVTSASAYDL